MSSWRVSSSNGRILFPLCELKYNPLTCLVHVFLSPDNVIVVPVVDFDGNRKKLPTKSFPGAVKCTRENLLPNDWIFILGKLSTMEAFPIVYSAHTIIVRVMTIFLFI